MTSAPSPNRLRYVRGVAKGASRAYAAIVIDHAAQYNATSLSGSKRGDA